MNLRDQFRQHDNEEKQAEERVVTKQFVACYYSFPVQVEQKGIGAPYDAVVRETRNSPRVLALIEVKTRNRRAIDVDHYKLDANKARKLRKLALVYNVPILLVVRFKGNDLRWLDLAKADFSQWREFAYKRKDRDERPDPTFAIPIQEFKRCEEGEERRK